MELLICLEGSPSTASALELAVGLVRSHGGTLAGLAIIDEPDIVAREPTSIGGTAFKRDRDTALLDDARARAREWLERFRERGRAAGIRVRAIELRGRPAEVIVAEMHHHDALVIGRDANFRFETEERDRFTRDRVLRRAGKPIFVVPTDPVGAVAKVMFAYDGSPAATRALRSFVGGGLARGRELHVATVRDDGANAFEIASEGCKLLAELGYTAVPENVVSVEPIATALLERRAKLGAGLIVLGGYVPSPLARLVWGSVTHELVAHTVVPVFLHY
jgi:nucleotide-binding universal stress UspA family protein